MTLRYCDCGKPGEIDVLKTHENRWPCWDCFFGKVKPEREKRYGKEKPIEKNDEN